MSVKKKLTDDSKSCFPDSRIVLRVLIGANINFNFDGVACEKTQAQLVQSMAGVC
jgi:hypothetical protein